MGFNMNSIRELGAIANDAVRTKGKRKAVRVLYIKADEDHVALQDGRCIEPKLVYVHEGRKKIGKDRWKLENLIYFSGVYAKSDALWAPWEHPCAGSIPSFQVCNGSNRAYGTHNICYVEVYQPRRQREPERAICCDHQRNRDSRRPYQPYPVSKAELKAARLVQNRSGSDDKAEDF